MVDRRACSGRLNSEHGLNQQDNNALKRMCSSYFSPYFARSRLSSTDVLASSLVCPHGSSSSTMQPDRPHHSNIYSAYLPDFPGAQADRGDIRILCIAQSGETYNEVAQATSLWQLIVLSCMIRTVHQLRMSRVVQVSAVWEPPSMERMHHLMPTVARVHR